ncbi:hypothetical protein BGZ94_007496 [Podila epigama]|nr:hypothetical protein BGZ94_007496 [Podila epigama]
MWTEALVPVCNQSQSHASQELRWLMQHVKEVVTQAQAKEKEGETGPTVGNVISGGRGRGSLTRREIELLQGFVDERVHGRKPLQYILGTQPFMDLEILTRPPTLIPRWETEEWTARLASTLSKESSLFHRASSSGIKSPFKVLDICTGSGCIPLGLASALPPHSSHLWGVDIHPKAVQLAKDNALKNEALLRGNTVEFQQADLLSDSAIDRFRSWTTRPQDMLNQKSIGQIGTAGFDLVISNPPYIAHDEYDTLEPEVSQWEDPNALLADEEGLMFYPRIAQMAVDLLCQPRTQSLRDSDSKRGQNPTPSSDDTDDHGASHREWRNGPVADKVRIPELVFEIGGDHQVDQVLRAVRQAGFRRVEVWKDLADRSRCILGAR